MNKKLIPAFLVVMLLSGVAWAEELIDQERLADAIYLAEGGKAAKVAYGILSVKVKDKAEARRVCLRTINNNLARWQWARSQGDQRGFIAYLGAKYAPLGAGNDPRGLNRAWVSNVTRLYNQALGL